MPRFDVVLVNMPWAEIVRPSMQLGLLKALLLRAGIAVHNYHPHLRFAERIGLEEYRAVDEIYRPTSEWLFSRATFRRSPDESDAYLELLRSSLGVPLAQLELIRSIHAQVDAFLQESLAYILDLNPRVVGFATSMLQTLPAAALARRIKEARPEIITVLGGASCEGPMGAALLEALPWVDVVVQPECDAYVADLFSSLLSGRGLERHPGLSWRRNGRVHTTPPAAPFEELDTNPRPLFDDFFSQLDQRSFASAFPRSVPFEGSRGCWWGRSLHCAFCGLNGLHMQWRVREPERVVDELVAQRAAYGVDAFFSVEQILPRSFYDTLAPLLADRLPGVKLFYEITPNLPRHVLEALSSTVDLCVQPGIESLSTPVLEAMHKGLRGIDNVRLLRRAQELGIGLLWNILVGVPGERPDDLEHVISQLPALVHCQPPDVLPVSLARFSPYHADPERYGIRILGPRRGLAYAYPVAPQLLEDIAWTFDFERVDGCDTTPQAARIAALVDAWKAHHAGAFLRIELVSEGALVTDARRSDATTHHRLNADETLLYRHLESARSVRVLSRTLRARAPATYVRLGGERGLRQRLGALLRRGLVWQEDDSFVALAVPAAVGFWIQHSGREQHEARPVS